MPSGGCSGSGELVPAILFASKAKERAHELQGWKRNWKQSRARCVTHWNSAATEGISRRRSRPESKEIEEFRRLSRLGSELGGALGSQGGGKRSGQLNLAREGWVVVNWREKLVGVLWLRTEETHGVAHAGAQRGGGSDPGASTSPGSTGSKQLHGRTHVRSAGRAAAALYRAGDPHRITVAGPYPPPFCLL